MLTQAERERLLERFIHYAEIDTQSDEHSDSSPSTWKQLDLLRLLELECQALGLNDITLPEEGVLLATIPATVVWHSPTIAWVAHVDTSPEFNGTGVRPIVHRDYQGGDIVLPSDPSQVIRVEQNPALKELLGGTIITTDGATLLGADDKAGVAVIMQAAEFMMKHREISCGPIRLVFTCDEEIGRGTENIHLERIDAVCAYTLDGDGQGMIDVETFSADLAVIAVQGVNTHPSIGKGKMVNAIRILSDFIAALPQDRLSPETTDGRDGFLHPYAFDGSVARAEARIILRDFETPKLEEYANLLRGIADSLQARHPAAGIDVSIRKQYRNMKDGLAAEPRAVAYAVEATRNAGLDPVQSVIRGGTDGSLLTAMGLPTPNLSTGEHNPHTPLEWTSLEEMSNAVAVLVELAKSWSREE